MAQEITVRYSDQLRPEEKPMLQRVEAFVKDTIWHFLTVHTTEWFALDHAGGRAVYCLRNYYNNDLLLCFAGEEIEGLDLTNDHTLKSKVGIAEQTLQESLAAGFVERVAAPPPEN